MHVHRSVISAGQSAAGLSAAARSAPCLPATREDSAALLANRTRMVLACEAARKRGAPCKLFPLGPLPDFACDFVPVNKQTLRLFMQECRTGSRGATAALQAYLNTKKAHRDGPAAPQPGAE